MSSCIAAATGVLGASAAAQSSFSPQISFADDGMYVDVRGDDVETVTLTMKDGTTLEFDGSLQRYGYNRSAPEPIEGWHGTIEQVEATNGEESKIRLNPYYRLDLEVGCSTYQTAEDVSSLRMFYENATKTYDPPQGSDGRQPATYGSPGRSLQEVVKLDNETCVTREGGCSPPDSRGVTFDCTSVTVHPDEFVDVDPACYGVELTFADGSTEQVASAGERRDPPVTFEGSGENEGKVIQSIGFSYDAYGVGWFHYENPNAGSCDPAAATTGSDGTENDTVDQTDDATSSDGDATSSDGDTSGSDDGSTTDTDASETDNASDDGSDDDTLETQTTEETDDGTTSTDGTSGGSDADSSDGGSTGSDDTTTSSEDTTTSSTDDATSTGDDSTTDADSSDTGSTDDSSSSGFNWRDLYHKW